MRWRKAAEKAGSAGKVLFLEEHDNMLPHMRMMSTATPGFLVGAAIGVVFTTIFHYCRNNSSLGDESYVDPRDDTEKERFLCRNSNSNSGTQIDDGRTKEKRGKTALKRNLKEDQRRGSSGSASPPDQYEANKPEMQPNYQVITADEWATDDEFIQQSKECDDFLSKLRSKEDMEVAFRRSWAVNSLARVLAEAKDEKACFEVISQLIVPLFQIDGFAYALVKVCFRFVYNTCLDTKHVDCC
jgi:hypothetical protein